MHMVYDVAHNTAKLEPHIRSLATSTASEVAKGLVDAAAEKGSVDFVTEVSMKLPLALIVTAGVPLLLALHITSMSALAKAPRTPLPVTGPLIAGATPRTAVTETPAAGAR